MKHPSSEDLLDLFYRKGDTKCDEHLAECAECQEQLHALKESLAAFDAYQGPERGADYGQEVWRRLATQLPASRRKNWVWRPWLVAPVLAALLGVAFALGFWTEHTRIQERTQAVSRARERVLLIAMSDHLERSQIVLTDLMHTNADAIDVPEERERARDLVGENRLLRQTALHLGDRSQAMLLDDLERALVDLANTPDDASLNDLKLLQQRIEKDGLLWKVRVMTTDSRRKGNSL